MLGVSRQRVHQLMQAYDDFPEPEADLAVGRIWKRSAITAWSSKHPRKPGRPAGSKTIVSTRDRGFESR
jgi:hypothetical protein